ncbi:cytochrome P460 family protein [Pseudenhygromyxa sp. WMMC2535]|uniref:cytochrome P460 family protein n=1 Tax=Pseudenhygromyxa sp. WMMC2535 TaxID=2712867 RepID=UPI0015556B27|nr:cytochrome P460 family protein [Pseudenhygromyxa sp. WMMC2535]NVB37279.1 cytochrome P460 family protein [Pseudenhygromyxa sp. WMMC2535]NVB43607.1 cytochrome P460 family protein [Pseudenhygromyxa sp. WMMC2535]
MRSSLACFVCPRSPASIVALCLCLAAGACVGEGARDGDEGEGGSADEGVDESGGEPGEPDAAALVDQALGYPDFERINAAPFASQHGLAASVNVWVPAQYADAYRAIDPDDAEATADFPAGAMIVKEHLDDMGEAVGVTIMVKAEAGYDPEHDDWWWGNADLEGNISDAGVVGYCVSCHEPRAAADWLFGVAPADQL